MPSPTRGTFSVAIRAGLGVLKCALLTVHTHYMHTERKKEREKGRKTRATEMKALPHKRGERI